MDRDKDNDDEHAPDGPDLEGMRRFVARGDRVPPDVFVGRRAALGLLDEALHVVRADGAAPPGIAKIVQGPPGIGKSSLLNELLRSRWGGAEGPPPRVVEVGDDAFGDRVELLARVLAELDAGPVEAGEHERRMDAGGGVGVPGLKASARWAETRRRIGPQATFESCAEQLERALGGAPLVLLVDEAQRIVPDAEDSRGRPLNRSLCDLQDARHGLPILPIYFGLSTTAGALMGMGLSRPSDDSIAHLPRLTRDECRECARGTLAKYRPLGLGAALERWARACADHADGWPRHLHNNLRSCMEELHAGGGDLDAADLDAAIASGARRRTGHYRERIERLAPYASAAVSALARLDGEHAAQEAVIGVLRECLAALAAPPADVAGAADELFDRMLVAGALAHIPDAPMPSFACPIPSFTRFARTAARVAGRAS